MKMRIIAVTCALGALGAPAAADSNAMAERLGVAAGKYSVAELVTIQNIPPGRERTRRVAIIDNLHRQRDANAVAAMAAALGRADASPAR